MARRPKVEVICDRCDKPYEDTAEAADAGAAATAAPSESRGVFIDATGLGLGEIVLEDLDPRCKKRVTDLITLIKKQKDSDETESRSTSDDAEQSTPRPVSRDASKQQHNPEEKR